MEKGNPPAYSPPQPGFNAPPGNSMYPPLPQQPPQQQMPQSNTVIVHQAVLPMMLGPKPTTMVCPSCHAQITSTVQTEATTKTHLFALLLCLFACWPCCCIPYCMDSCQSQTHYCPNCNAFLGKYDN
nr:lipopolysaccharide-induced tumor necrosis factor-alpha factor homolog [Leptinotarsa decemlineata]